MPRTPSQMSACPRVAQHAAEKQRAAEEKLRKLLKSNTWQRVALIWAYQGLRVVTNVKVVRKQSRDAPVAPNVPGMTRGGLSPLRTMDKLLGDVITYITAQLREHVPVATRGRRAADFPCSAIRSLCLFFLCRAGILPHSPMKEVQKDGLFPLYRKTDGTVGRITTRMMMRFRKHLFFRLQTALDLLSAATIRCLTLPSSGLLIVACDETIIKSDIKDDGFIDIPRKPNSGYLVYTTAIRLPHSQKSVVLHFAASSCRQTEDGEPVSAFLGPEQVMADVADFLHGLQQSQSLTKDIVIVMDAFFGKPDVVLRRWESLGFMGSIGLKKKASKLVELLGDGLGDRRSRMVSVSGLLVSIYRDGDNFVANASSAFTFDPESLRSHVRNEPQRLVPLHSPALSSFMYHMYDFVKGDLRVMDLGLVNGPSQSKEKSFQRALGWPTATIKTMIPPPALVDAVTAYANHLRAVTGLPPLLVPSPPAQLEQVAADTVCDMEEDAGSRRLLPRARAASDVFGQPQQPSTTPAHPDIRLLPADDPSRLLTKQEVDHTLCMYLVKQGFVQELRKVPKWNSIVELGKLLGMVYRSGPRGDFKRELLDLARKKIGVIEGVAGQADLSTAVTEDCNVDQEAHAGQPDQQQEEQELQALLGEGGADGEDDTRDLPADSVLPPGWRETIPSEAALMEKTEEQLKTLMLELHRNAKVPNTKRKLARSLRKMMFKLCVNPSFVRETISCYACPGKTVPMIFHGETFAAVDKFDQCFATIASPDTVAKRYIRLLRWITEAAFVTTHGLMVESHHEVHVRPASAAQTLLEIAEEFGAEQEKLAEELAAQP